MKTGIPTNESMVKNHISLKTEFGLSATQRTSFLSWFQACQVLPRHLHQLHGHLWKNRRVLLHLLHPHFLHLQQAKFWFEKGKMHQTVTSLQCQCPNWLMIDRRNLRKFKPTKSQKQIKRKTRYNGETRVVILKSRNGCKNSGKIWWMMKFHYREALSPVPLMRFL